MSNEDYYKNIIKENEKNVKRLEKENRILWLENKKLKEKIIKEDE